MNFGLNISWDSFKHLYFSCSISQFCLFFLVIYCFYLLFLLFNHIRIQYFIRNLSLIHLEDSLTYWVKTKQNYKNNFIGHDYWKLGMKEDDLLENNNKIKACELVKKQLTNQELTNLLQLCAQNYNSIMLSYNLLWKLKPLSELNDRITYLYKFMNQYETICYTRKREHEKLDEKIDEKIDGKIDGKLDGKIPCVHISKHHHAVQYVMQYIKDCPGTILHVDSHADMNRMFNQREKMIHLLKKKDFTDDVVDEIKTLNYDIGCVLIPMLTPYEKNNGILWLTPDWVDEPFQTDTCKLSIHDEYIQFYGGSCPKNVASIDDMNYENFKMDPTDTEVIFSTCNLNYIQQKKHLISDDYILNIDLDYFVTFGDPNYGELGYDVISDFRTIFDYGFTCKDSDNMKYIIEKLELEMNIIIKRVDLFLEFIFALKKENKWPKMIVLCDSTCVDNTFYDAKKHSSEFIHEFTPKYLCFWLHNLLIKGLNKIFE